MWAKNMMLRWRFQERAMSVLEDSMLFPGYAYLVAGDFNVGHSDKEKNGKSLKKDCYKDCGRKDRYDETHALLRSGLVHGLKMNNLAKGIPDATYPGFPGSPIDNIYVYGDLAERFEPAKKASKAYGSDHLPVWTFYDFGD